MRAEFGEGCLCEVDGKVAVVVAKVRGGNAEEVINVAHEVDLTEGDRSKPDLDQHDTNRNHHS